MIEVQNVVKTFDGFRALDGLSMSVPGGAIYGLVGPNGAGKSTTMNMITGYLAPTGGTVAIDGHDVQEEPKEAKACIGYLPEIPPLYTDMTVQEYLLFVSELKGKKKKVARAVQRTVPAVTAAGGLSLFAAAHHREDDCEHDPAKREAPENRGPIIC